MIKTQVHSPKRQGCVDQITINLGALKGVESIVCVDMNTTTYLTIVLRKGKGLREVASSSSHCKTSWTIQHAGLDRAEC